MLLNSHRQPFSDARPKTPADCTEVLIGVLRDDLKRDADESCRVEGDSCKAQTATAGRRWGTAL